MTQPRSILCAQIDRLPHCTFVPARDKHTATIIFLHGLGDSGRALASNLSDFTRHPGLSHVRFIFPTASFAPVTALAGRYSSSWFDCYSFDHDTRDEDEEGLIKSATWINEIITSESELHGIHPSRILMGGFSQGGCVAMLTALANTCPIAGLFMLSSYIPFRQKINEIIVPERKTIPIFWAHGMEDEQVPYGTWKDFARTLAHHLQTSFIDCADEKAKVDKEELRAELKALRFYSYVDLGHWVNEKEFEDFVVWIEVLLPNDAAEN